MGEPVLSGTTLKALACNLSGLEQLPSSITSKADRVTEINLSFNSLSSDSLHFLEPFTNVHTLILDNNEITTLTGLPQLPHLHTLWVNNNLLRSVEEDVVGVISSRCPRLLYLSLLRNPCCPNELVGKGDAEYRRYRLYLRYRIPTLQMLDASPFSPEDILEAKEKGRFMHTATATAKQTITAVETANTTTKKMTQEDSTVEVQKSSVEEDFFTKHNNNNAPSSGNNEANDTTPGQQNGPFFTQQRHFYSGKASEGNRFIKDDVL